MHRAREYRVGSGSKNTESGHASGQRFIANRVKYDRILELEYKYKNRSAFDIVKSRVKNGYERSSDTVTTSLSTILDSTRDNKNDPYEKPKFSFILALFTIFQDPRNEKRVLGHLEVEKSFNLLLPSSELEIKKADGIGYRILADITGGAVIGNGNFLQSAVF
uniref:Uncharacterized protein n=1 Tax=Romanomermis culicivorax TaxID=13658 RepID=A0A915KFN3_ROMCU